MADDDYQLPEDKKLAIKEVFDKFDEKGNGTISTKKIGTVFMHLGYHLKPADLEEFIAEADYNNSGDVVFDEFIPFITQKIKEKEDEDYYKNLFRILDKGKKGFIPVDDLRYILTGLMDELELTEEDVNDMIENIDEDGNGEVSFEEFHQLMTSD